MIYWNYVNIFILEDELDMKTFALSSVTIKVESKRIQLKHGWFSVLFFLIEERGIVHSCQEDDNQE